MGVPLEPLVGIVSLSRPCAAEDCLRRSGGRNPDRGGVQRAPERTPQARLTALPQCTAYDGYQREVLNGVLIAAFPDPAFIESNAVIDPYRHAPGVRQRNGRDRDDSQNQARE